MISMKTNIDKYTYGSVSSSDMKVFTQDYCDPDTGNDVTAEVKIRVDVDGVVVEVTDNGEINSIAIPTHDLSLAVAEYILKSYTSDEK